MRVAGKRGGFSLIELLCVIAIILILIGLMLGPIMRAYKRAKRLQEDGALPHQFYYGLPNHSRQFIAPEITWETTLAG